MEDKINHPKHYTNSEAYCLACGTHIECIDVTRHMNFNIGNVIKYLWRYKDKNGLEDLKKAQWYLNDFIKNFDSNNIQLSFSRSLAEELDEKIVDHYRSCKL